MTPPRVPEEHPRFAVDLGNTVACPMCRGDDALASAQEAQRWIRRKLPGEAIRIRPEDLPTLRRFRGQLRQLLLAAASETSPPAAAMAAINRALVRSPTHSELHWARGSFEVGEHPEELSTVQHVEALAGRSFVHLLGEAPPTRIRVCEGPGCVHFLVARRPQQHWCSATGCGNRVRVQRHYRKVRGRARARTSRSLRPW